MTIFSSLWKDTKARILYVVTKREKTDGGNVGLFSFVHKVKWTLIQLRQIFVRFYVLNRYLVSGEKTMLTFKFPWNIYSSRLSYHEAHERRKQSYNIFTALRKLPTGL